MQAWRELILMLPNEQPLEREMEHERDPESDRQRYLKGCPNDFGEFGRGAQINHCNGGTRQTVAYALAEQSRARRAQGPHRGKHAAN